MECILLSYNNVQIRVLQLISGSRCARGVPAAARAYEAPPQKPFRVPLYSPPPLPRLLPHPPHPTLAPRRDRHLLQLLINFTKETLKYTSLRNASTLYF